MLAYRAYLTEIAVAYNLPGDKFLTALELSQRLTLDNRHSAEVSELLNLEEKPSWISSLTDIYRSLGDMDISDTVKTHSNVSLSSPNSLGIPVTQLNTTAELSIETCRGWFNSLSQVIESQRDRLEEW